jgi:hypothetical protein
MFRPWTELLGAALSRGKIGWNILLVLTALLAAVLAARPANALRAEIDALPTDIQTLYDAGQYRQAAEALRAEVERNPKDAGLPIVSGRHWCLAVDTAQPSPHDIVDQDVETDVLGNTHRVKARGSPREPRLR